MASFVSMNLNSDSDSDDTDFVPETNKYSDDSGSDTEGKVTNKRKKDNTSIRAGGIFLEDDTREKKSSDSRSAEFEQEVLDRKEIETEKKVDDLWADFKKDTSVANVTNFKKNNDKPRSLGTLCSMNPPKKKIKNKTVPVKKHNKDLMSSIFGGFDSKDTEGINKQIEKENKEITKEPKSILSSIFESVENLSSPQNHLHNKCETNDNSVIPNTDIPSSSSEKTITISQTYDFAGENVEIIKSVDRDSKEGKKFLKQENETNFGISNKKNIITKRNASGLNSIMGVISGKKPKLGCLDKSKMDWNKYVEEEGIKEELQTHNKGKEGYVEKQMFLERADHRRFEIEKEAREKTRKPLNN